MYVFILCGKLPSLRDRIIMRSLGPHVVHCQGIKMEVMSKTPMINVGIEEVREGAPIFVKFYVFKFYDHDQCWHRRGKHHWLYNFKFYFSDEFQNREKYARAAWPWS